MTGAWLALALVSAWSLLGAPPARAARAIDYLYIDASEGGGSGGHAAIAFGTRVFHFEHRAPGILRLAREPIENIRHRYGMFESRTILVSHVTVTDETYELILDELTRRYLVQHQHLSDQRALVDDRRLLEAARGQRLGRPDREPMMLEGAGFFFDDAVVPTPGAPRVAEAGVQAPALVALRERVDTALGPDAVLIAMRRIHAELSELAPDSSATPKTDRLLADQLAPARSGLSQRYRNAVLSLLALDVLRTTRPLRSGSEAGPDLPPLSADDVRLVERLEDALRDSLVRMVQSSRPDWGFPLLLGMARLVALDETRRTGRWVVLDALPADATLIQRERFVGRPDVTRNLRGRAARDFATARHWLRGSDPAGGFPELEFAELEAAGSRLVEVETALRESRDLRVAWGTIVPARPAPHREPFLPAIEERQLGASLAMAREREAEHAAELMRLYGYNLVTRNCVTEIFRTIEFALARDVLAGDPTLRGSALATRVATASVERLGGHVDPGGPLNFIPAVSASAVQSTYAVSVVDELPSYRKTRLALMYERENPVWVFLRESNTLTSTLYRRAPDDSAFLFFTDDATPARPLLGALNLVAGLGVAAAGLAMLPVDHGNMLRAGLRGALFSLPELAFFNIRKGSFPEFNRRGPERPEPGG